MGVNGIGGGNRQNTWNYNDMISGAPLRNASKAKRQSGGVALYAGNSTALSAGLLGQDQTKAFAAGYSKAFFSAQERAKETKKAQNTGKKDPEYNHKKFSRKMKNAKNSQSMQSVLADIRATIADLKAKQATGEYDEEEIAAAILHAELMEAAAMKRADNLEQEEMAERKLKREELEELLEGTKDEEQTGVPAAGAGDPAQEAAEADLEEQVDAEMQAMMEEMKRIQQEMADQMAEEMEEMMAEASEEDPMQALDDMAKILGASVSEEDVDEMKKKHRAAEDMAAARADMEYLKIKFDRLQRERNALKSGAAGLSKGMGQGSAPQASGFADGAKIVAGAVKSAHISAVHHASSLSSSAAASVSASDGSSPAAGASIDISG